MPRNPPEKSGWWPQRDWNSCSHTAARFSSESTTCGVLSQRVAGGDGNPQAVSCSGRKTRQRAEVSPLLRK
jgi:hypothetical protein